MDFSVKQAARSKHKHTQHLKRVHGGRGRGRGGTSSAARHGPELESNYDRYETSNDEAAAEAEGQLVRQSEGADLEQLLAESEQFYAQAHFRYRSFLDTADTEPPPVDVAALEQGLALEVEPLVQALALLSPAELLGIEPEYLMACDPANDVAGAGPPPAAAAVTAGLQSSSTSVQQAGEQQQQRQPVQPVQQQQGSKINLPPFVQQGQPAAAPAAAKPSAVNEKEEEDDILQQLLSGTSTAQQPPPAAMERASSLVQSSSVGSSHLGSSNTSSSRPDRMMGSSTPAAAAPAHLAAARVGVAAAPGPAPAAVPTEPAAAAGGGAVGDDDDLDELLGLCGAVQQPDNTQAPSQPAAGRTDASKKQSLQDWLDGF